MPKELALLGVELIEQPLPAGDRAGMTRVRARSPVPLFADEDCVGPADVAACEELFDGVNIKPVKCGSRTIPGSASAWPERLFRPTCWPKQWLYYPADDNAQATAARLAMIHSFVK